MYVYSIAAINRTDEEGIGVSCAMDYCGEEVIGIGISVSTGVIMLRNERATRSHTPILRRIVKENRREEKRRIRGDWCAGDLRDGTDICSSGGQSLGCATVGKGQKRRSENRLSM